MTKQCGRGFTLIELLVVIAIIAILAALLFPVFLAAQERGRTAACTSNLRQIAMAFQMYCDESNGMVPFAADAEDRHDCSPNPSVRFPFPYPWVVMKPYCKGDRVWQCPSDKGLKWLRPDNGGTGWPTVAKNCYNTWGSSYSYRTAVVIKNWDYIYSGSLKASDIKPCIISQFRKPSRAVIFFDPLEYTESNPPAMNDWNAQWHSFKYPTFGWNMAFADGHARMITKEQLYHPRDNCYGHWLLNDYYIRPEYPN